jgi:hypothetical protein
VELDSVRVVEEEDLTILQVWGGREGGREGGRGRE